MSLWPGYWEVLAVDPTGKCFTCRCVCGATVVVLFATLDETTTCTACGHRPLALQQRDELRAEQAQQLTFGW
jgi:hypothetical protein